MSCLPLHCFLFHSIILHHLQCLTPEEKRWENIKYFGSRSQHDRNFITNDLCLLAQHKIFNIFSLKWKVNIFSVLGVIWFQSISSCYLCRYNILFFLLTYVLPMIGMGVCYIQMGRRLWNGDKSALALLVPQAALTKSRNDKKKIVKMFAFVVVIFMVCWAPYHIYFIYCYHNPSVTRNPYIGHIYLGFYWLAMSNTCVNPIIYYWMNQRFRAYFNQVLCCVPSIISRTAKSQWSRQSQSVNQVKVCPCINYNCQLNKVEKLTLFQMSFVYRGRSKSFAEVDLKSRVARVPTCPEIPLNNTIMTESLENKIDTATNTRLVPGENICDNMNSLEFLDYSLTFRYRSEVLLWIITNIFRPTSTQWWGAEWH